MGVWVSDTTTKHMTTFQGYEAVSNLLIQIPLVGIFIIFILEWSKRMDKAILERDEKWRDFLREERLFRAEMLRAIAEEIQKNTETLSRMKNDIARHEADALLMRRRKDD
mgnify:CR=1 FL=1